MNQSGAAAPVASSRAASPAGRLGAVLILAFFVALVHIVGLARDRWKVLDGELMGPDSYMRLVRVQRLHETGAWYDSSSPRSNTPYGEVLHWSRPFDLLLLAGAALTSPLAGFGPGLFLSGVLVGPLLHALTLIVLLSGARALLARPELVLTALMFLFQASISSQFQAGRPDHHGLQGLLFAVLIACTLKMLAQRARRPAIVAGLAAALAVWVSVEALPAVALVMAALACAWLRRGAAFTGVGLAFALAAAAGLTVALAVERPPQDWLADEYDRLSIAHLAAFLAHAVAWLMLVLWQRFGRPPRSVPRRGALAAAAAVSVVAVIWLLYPKLFAGPMVDVPLRVRELWLPQISEMLSIVDQAEPGRGLYLLLLYLGAALPAAAYMVWLVLRGPGAERGLWLFLLLATLLYLLLAAQQLRWGIYAQLAALPAYGKLLHLALRRFGLEMAAAGARPRQFSGILLLTLGRLAVLLVFALGFPLAALLVKPAGEARASAPGVGLLPACDVAALSRALSADDGGRGGPRRILTFIFDGPELLYRTPHSVVATPYHRNSAGILDTYEFFAAVDPEVARAIVRRRGIDWIVVCPRGSESQLYQRSGEATMLDRLRQGELPDWLVPLETRLPPSGDWRLFQVRE